MKKIIIATIGLTIAGSAVAAAYYEGICQSCSSAASYKAAAVVTAEEYGAVVGDQVDTCKFTAMGNRIDYLYTVNTAPVTSASDLTFVQSYLEMDTDC